MHGSLKLAGLAIVGLAIKWLVLKWATQKAIGVFDWTIRKLLGKYPEELAIWVHYQKRKRKLGHQYPNPLRCQDEDCKALVLR